MKSLLENDLPAHYVIGRRCTCTELLTSACQFDLTEDDHRFVVPYETGFASFIANPFHLSVINYDTYMGRFSGTRMGDGKRRCDFILTDTDANDLVILCELTSSIGGTANLSLPITKTRRDGTQEMKFHGGKYEKAETQLSDTLDTLMAVPTIRRYVSGKKRKVCLMSYLIKPSKIPAVNAFNRNRMAEAEEAGENGAQISLPQVEQYGFQYFRISHKYAFCISNDDK